MKKFISVVFGLTLMSFLSSCNLVSALLPILTDTYSVTVENRCSYADYYVRFYLDGDFKAIVQNTYTVTGISKGTHRFAAYGTGTGGNTFTNTYYVDRNFTWVLCPNGGASTSQETPQ